jgi:hypothetical protein
MLLHDVNPDVFALAGRFLGDANQSIKRVSLPLPRSDEGSRYLHWRVVVTICIGAAQR